MRLKKKAAEQSGDIGFAELHARFREPGLRLVNVLNRHAFEEGRIPGSQHLPLADIPTQAARELPNRHQEIVVYCGGAT